MNPRSVIASLLLLKCASLATRPLAAQPAPSPQPPAPATQPAEDRAALEAKFIKQMTGVSLVGFFSDSNHPDRAPAAERYDISRVTKLGGDVFVFHAKFKTKNGEVEFPLPIPVKWAGDTPVITVTNMGIPGMGTFTARVLIYDDQYAGTWRGTNHGGNLWGTIERAAKEPAAKEPAANEPAAPAPAKPE